MADVSLKRLKESKFPTMADSFVCSVISNNMLAKPWP